jgi:hypothetical protein
MKIVISVQKKMFQYAPNVKMVITKIIILVKFNVKITIVKIVQKIVQYALSVLRVII